jgi:hypothetical protein
MLLGKLFSWTDTFRSTHVVGTHGNPVCARVFWSSIILEGADWSALSVCQGLLWLSHDRRHETHAF